MDGDRKYRQHGYQDSHARNGGHSNGESRNGTHSARNDRPKPNGGPRLPIDITGPKLPRLVQSVTAARCFNCAVTLPAQTDFKGECPKCGAALHSCKMCVHFDSSTRFQCTRPIPVRIPIKDQANDCTLFTPRLTVARDSAPASSRPLVNPIVDGPRNASDARAAFDNLFKK